MFKSRLLLAGMTSLFLCCSTPFPSLPFLMLIFLFFIFSFVLISCYFLDHLVIKGLRLETGFGIIRQNGNHFYKQISIHLCRIWGQWAMILVLEVFWFPLVVWVVLTSHVWASGKESVWRGRTYWPKCYLETHVFYKLSGFCGFLLRLKCATLCLNRSYFESHLCYNIQRLADESLAFHYLIIFFKSAFICKYLFVEISQNGWHTERKSWPGYSQATPDLQKYWLLPSEAYRLQTDSWWVTRLQWK